MSDSKVDIELKDAAAVVAKEEDEPVEIETYSSLMRPALAEFVGSAMFVYFACGAAAGTVRMTLAGTTLLSISLAFGFIIVTLAFTIGHISGGHLNFAVTFAFFVVKKISSKRCVTYFVAQLAGGILGALLLRMTVPDTYLVTCLAANTVADATQYVKGACALQVLV